MDLFQKAFLETAQAYCRLGIKAQYDSEPLTYQERFTFGPSRLSSGAAPEEAAADRTLYTVCSDFCYDVYKNAFDYELMGGVRECPTFNMTALPADHPMVVVKVGREDGIQDKNEGLKELRKNLQVGDILVEYASGLDGGPKGGHAMLFVGDILGDGHDYLMHSGGGKISMDTGIDVIEPKGTIRLNDCDDYCFNPENKESQNNFHLPRYDEFVILRPFNDPAFPGKLTPTAHSRLKYPGIVIDRSFDRYQDAGAFCGEAVTVHISVKNTSKEDYRDLCVKETLPVGAAVEGGKAPQWKFTVPAESEISLQYTATITAKDGEIAVFPAGTVDEIPTRELSLPVREKREYTCTATKFANGFCRTVYGADLGLPEDPAEMITGLFDLVDAPDTEKTNGKLLTPKKYEDMKPEMQKVWDKVLPLHVGGRAVCLNRDGESMECFNRVKEFKPEAYRPGDVFFCLESPSILKLGNYKRAIIYIYLGEGRVLTWNVEKGPLMATFEDTIARALRMNVILGMRP